MKLTIRDRVILLIATIGIISYGGYQILWQPGLTKTAQMEHTKEELEGLALDISPLFKKTETLDKEEKMLNEKVTSLRDSSLSATLTKEDFLVLLGDSTQNNNAKLLKFQDLGISDADGLWEATYDMELQGTAYALGAVLSDIEKTGIKYSAGSISLRQNKDYPYLKRYFDDISNLPWYSEPEPTKTPQPSEMPEASPLPEYLPEIITPAPQEPSTQPTPTPYHDQPEVSPGPEDKSIEKRLDELLTQTSYSGSYEIRLLNTVQPDDTFEVGEEMRLAVTIRFIMMNEPTPFNGISKGDV